ncbi:MAG TPA: hypothetical protein VGQ80_05350 [Acidimicrobiia bacterium]|nr:hypothetical protein [Acidimicrobiia bacterium]
MTAGAPWTGRQVSIMVALNVIAAVAIVGGWVWSSGRTVLDDQIPATALTVAGLVVAGLANMGWLLAGRRGLARVKLGLFGQAGDGR